MNKNLSSIILAIIVGIAMIVGIVIVYQLHKYMEEEEHNDRIDGWKF